MKKLSLGFTGFATMLFLLMSGTTFSQLNPIKFYEDSLTNGLQIIYCVDKSAPVVATVMHYRVGSKNELPTQTGYAHFFEHLMFEATENIARNQIDKFVQEAGGNLNASTSFDQTVYHFKLPSNQLKLALWIEAQRMRKLLVDTLGVETQRGVVLEEMKERTSNRPYGSLMQKTVENLFTGSSYGWPVIGSEKNIAAATIDQFKKFYNSFYQPNNATLVITGDFEIGEIREVVRKYFGDYSKKPEIPHSKPVLQPLTAPYRETITDNKVRLPGIFKSYRGPSRNDSDFYAVSLLNDILSKGESSRLYRRLVDKEGIAVNADIMPLTLEYAGVLMLIGIASPGKSLEKIEEIMKEEIDKVIKEGITKEELEKAKNMMEAEFVSDKKNVLGKARSLAEYKIYYNNPGMINTEIDEYLKVTTADIKIAAKKYFGTVQNVTLIYLPGDN